MMWQISGHTPRFSASRLASGSVALRHRHTSHLLKCAFARQLRYYEPAPTPAALVPYSGTEWTTAVAALLDGLDIVVVTPPVPVAPAVASRLAAGTRQRGSVFLPAGAWANADLTVATSAAIRGHHLPEVVADGPVVALRKVG